METAAATKPIYALRTCKADGTSYGGFRWPEHGPVEAPDWRPDAECGGGTATAGDGGTLVIRWHDGRRYRLAVGYVGEGGIEPNVAYRLDGEGRFVRAEGRVDA